MADTNVYVEPGFKNESVKNTLSMIEKNSIIHNRHEGIWRVIQQLFEEGFSVSNPQGTKKITSKLILQVLWKVVNKMKVPDFKIYKAGPFARKTDLEEIKKESTVRDWIEQVVTAGVSTVMKEGNFIRCMRDKGGAFYKTALFGDAHVMMGYDEDNSDYPITFKVGSLSDTYMNNSATEIRDAVGGLSCDRMAVIFRYTMDQFNELFPEWKGKVAKGEIPRAYRYKKQLEKTWTQTLYEPDEEIEVCYSYGIDKTMVVFAGAPCTVIKELTGKEYPYIMDKKPYIPILHFKFFPSSEGYFNYGIAHMIFDLAVVTAQLDNMAYGHAGDNVYPINFVNTTSKNASKIFNEIMKAHESRAVGKKGYVVSENPAGGSGVTVESFQSQPITNEWERAFTRLEQQVTRLGFGLDMPDLGANPNEMSIMAEQEATDAPIKQIIEFNSSEFEMAVNMTISAIREFVPDKDQTPLNSTVDIETGDIQTPLRNFSLGNVAQELRQNKYFVVVNSRDGTMPSGVMQNAQIDKTMAKLMPGTPAWNKMAVKQAKLNGQNVTEEDMGMPQAPTGAPEGEAAPVVSETSPLNAATLKHPQLQQ